MANQIQLAGSSINMKEPPKTARRVEGVLAACRNQFADLLPKHITPERFFRSAALACARTPKLLMDCSMQSILMAALDAAQVGLDCGGGTLGEGYLVPYAGEAKFIPGYRGYIVLAQRGGEVASVACEVVYKDDEFQFEKGANPVLRHVPNMDGDERDDDIIGAYAIFRFKNGGEQREFMSRRQIEKSRAVSKAQRDDSPWKKWYSQMCRKTVIKRGMRYVPVSSEALTRALELDEADYEPEIHAAETLNRRKGTSALKERIEELKPQDNDSQSGEPGDESGPDGGQTDSNVPEGQNGGGNGVSGGDKDIEKILTLQQDDFLAEVAKIIPDPDKGGIYQKAIGIFVKLHTPKTGVMPAYDRRKLYDAVRDGKLNADGRIAT